MSSQQTIPVKTLIGAALEYMFSERRDHASGFPTPALREVVMEEWMEHWAARSHDVALVRRLTQLSEDHLCR